MNKPNNPEEKVEICHTCKYAGDIPDKLIDEFSDLLPLFTHKYYCNKLHVVKVYNPDVPAQLFRCNYYEPKT